MQPLLFRLNVFIPRIRAYGYARVVEKNLNIYKLKLIKLKLKKGKTKLNGFLRGRSIEDLKAEPSVTDYTPIEPPNILICISAIADLTTKPFVSYCLYKVCHPLFVPILIASLRSSPPILVLCIYFLTLPKLLFSSSSIPYAKYQSYTPRTSI